LSAAALADIDGGRVRGASAPSGASVAGVGRLAVSADSERLARIRELDARFQRLTGREAFGYVSAPTPTSERWVFQDGSVCLSAREALDYMSTLVWLATNEPAKLPFPFDQPLPPERDLR
jgi:hypothetical protein